MSEEQISDFLSPEAAAKYLGVTTAHLQRLRKSGEGPVYSRPSTKLIRYEKSDLDDWLKLHKVRPTA